MYIQLPQLFLPTVNLQNVFLFHNSELLISFCMVGFIKQFSQVIFCLLTVSMYKLCSLLSVYVTHITWNFVIIWRILESIFCIYLFTFFFQLMPLIGFLSEML